MAEQHYKVRPKKPFDVFTSDDLTAAKFCQVRFEGYPSRNPRGQWYCMTSGCIVRQVTVRCKTYGEPVPKMWCPVCGETMKFEHWIEVEMLVPVGGDCDSSSTSSDS